MLGWVDPRDLRTYNFRVENPVLETITLSAEATDGRYIRRPPVSRAPGTR